MNTTLAVARKSGFGTRIAPEKALRSGDKREFDAPLKYRKSHSRTCPRCGKVFLLQKTESGLLERKKYCSDKCRWPPRIRKCVLCKKDFIVRTSNFYSYYCSASCYHEAQRIATNDPHKRCSRAYLKRLNSRSFLKMVLRKATRKKHFDHTVRVCCKRCGKIFRQTKSHLARNGMRKFCSQECYHRFGASPVSRAVNINKKADGTSKPTWRESSGKI